MTRGAIVETITVLLAALAAWLPISPVVVESWYSTGWYPHVQRALTPLSNHVPFALFDAIVIATVTLALVILVRAVRAARRTRRLTALLAGVRHLACLVAVLYLAFLVTWGLNYRRLPMTDRLVMQPGPPDSERVVALGLQAVAEMNALHQEAHASGWRDVSWTNPALRDGFARAQGLLSDALPAAPGRLKSTIFGPYFRWTGVDGMVDPFALEVLANPDLLPWERPFVTAHEWSHLAGYADESEANFVGWLTCLRGDAAARYSGWLYLYWQVNGEVSAAGRKRLAEAIAPGPREDINAVVDRLRRGQLPTLRAASWVVYDQYLKANHVEEGIRSYGAVITLILQSRFDDGWQPLRRPGVAPTAPAPGS